MEEETKSWCELIEEKTINQMKEIVEEGITADNITYLSKLVDIHKDLSNEKYWKEKIETMRYRNYGEYGDNDSYGRRMRDSRGRYMDSSYGRQGVKGTGPYSRYRGDDVFDEMYDRYGEYTESKEMYGSNNGTIESLDKMLVSVKDFMKMLKRDAKSQEEVEMIRETAKEISEM